MTCTHDQDGDSGSHLNCQKQCEAAGNPWENNCVGITVTDQSPYDDSCNLCYYSADLVPAFNGFGFYRRPVCMDITVGQCKDETLDVIDTFNNVESADECNTLCSYTSECNSYIYHHESGDCSRLRDNITYIDDCDIRGAGTDLF